MLESLQHGGLSKGRRTVAARAALVLALAGLLASCQSAIEQTYQPTVAPSSTPQIVTDSNDAACRLRTVNRSR